LNVAKGFVVPYIFFRIPNKDTAVDNRWRWWRRRSMRCPEWVVPKNGHLYFLVIGVFQ
jgi:hypothetical protein